MTIQETKTFLERIKSYYQSFMVDDFFIKEWYGQLKDYEAKDINERFNQHLKSETYGEYVPKISFLVKGLRKIGEKGIDKSLIYERCTKCGRLIPLSEHETHFDLCNDIDYMNFLSEKYLGKPIDKEKCFEMPKEEFYEKFKRALAYSINKEQNSEEVDRLKEILQVVELGDE